MSTDKEKLLNVYLIPMISLAILLIFILVLFTMLNIDFKNHEDKFVKKVVTVEGMNTYSFSDLLNKNS